MRKSIMLVALICAFSCTENQRARSFGGEETIQLEKNRKLVNLTWKQDNLWILTTYAEKTDTAKTYYFQEESSFGMLEGTVKIKENF